MPDLFSLAQLFGQRPGYSNVTNPTSQGSSYWQLGQVYPNLSQGINTAAGNINSELQGQLPSDVTADIKDQGAAWGLQTGMPGSGAAGNYTLQDLGMTSLEGEQQGLSNYLNFAPSLQSMFTLNPEGTGAIDQAQAAPNPEVGGFWNDVAQGKDAGVIGNLGTSLLNLGVGSAL